jgi:multidrug efflux pump subunit AcrA (membrane-fusion protein)
VSIPGGSGPTLTAKVSAALASFDGGSRALKVRLEADNPRLTLRPDMFVDLAFSIVRPEATTVPAESVVGSGPDEAVYVAGDGGAFTRRAVTTGWRSDGRVQILKGLTAGESIVVSGNALLEAESRMRRGDVGRHD